MARDASHNALREQTQGALTKNASYRNPAHAIDSFDIGNRQPDRAYRLVSKSMLDRYGGFDRRGWIVLDEKNAKGETLKSPWGEAVIGSGISNRVEDLVVAFMPKEMYDRKQELIRKANMSAKDHIKGFKQQVKSAGGITDGGVETQRDGISETY